jgi:hypothetical protein
LTAIFAPLPAASLPGPCATSFVNELEKAGARPAIPGLVHGTLFSISHCDFEREIEAGISQNYAPI